MPEKLLPLSVQILTWNSAETLPHALGSIGSCTEILCIDGGSTDSTLAIARERNAVVLQQRPQLEQGKPLLDFAAGRNVGLRYTHEPWILCLDSDELISPELWEEVTAIITAGPPPTACYVPRRYVFPDGTIIRHATTYPNERIYFFHRDAVTEWIKPVHERVYVKPGVPIRHLAGATLAPLASIATFRAKNDQYIALEASRAQGKGWAHWFRHQLIRSVRAQIISCVRFLWIWIIPRRRTRLPLAQEMVRWLYRWKLVWRTRPWRDGN